MSIIERNRWITMIVALLSALLIGSLLPLARAAHAAPSITTTIRNGIWISPAELAQLLMAGSAWQQRKAAVDGNLGAPNIANQNSNHDVKTLAVALVYARTGNAAYRTKAADAIMAAISTERGGRTLALGRNLVSSVSFSPAEALIPNPLLPLRQEKGEHGASQTHSPLPSRRKWGQR